MAEYSEIIHDNNQMKGIVDDGTKAIPIENRFGKKICTVYLRPGDLSIIDRYDEVIKNFSQIVEPLKDLDIKNDGTAKFDDDWEIIKSVERELYDKLDYMFDMEESKEIFAKRNPFSAVGGRFFCENVIELLGDIIANGIEEETERMQKRTDAYLNDLKTAEKPLEVDDRDRESAADA